MVKNDLLEDADWWEVPEDEPLLEDEEWVPEEAEAEGEGEAEPEVDPEADAEGEGEGEEGEGGPKIESFLPESLIFLQNFTVNPISAHKKNGFRIRTVWIWTTLNP
jgi:hypothetical protein